jgi:hypothetical protein
MSTEKHLTKIAVFKGKTIRKTIYKNEWWFSVVDVCGVLSESVDIGAYWRKLKQRLRKEGSEVVTFCHGLKIKASDGKGPLPVGSPWIGRQLFYYAAIFSSIIIAPKPRLLRGVAE